MMTTGVMANEDFDDLDDITELSKMYVWFTMIMMLELNQAQKEILSSLMSLYLMR